MSEKLYERQIQGIFVTEKDKIVESLNYNGYISFDERANIRKYIDKTQQENTNLKQALNEIREYCKNISTLYWVDDDEPKYVSKDILQIIDKVLGDDLNDK